MKLSRKIQILFNELLTISLAELGEVAYANYAERERSALNNIDLAFKAAQAAHPEYQESLTKINHQVHQAIEHVGSANYFEREQEARKMIYQAFDDYV